MNPSRLRLPALLVLLIPLSVAAPGAAQGPDLAGPPTVEGIPPGAEGSLAALDASPRHGEWAVVRLPNGDNVRSWVVYPERSGPAPVLVVIHEIMGLTHWVRAVADRAAAEGYIAVAPDLLTMEDVPTDETGDPQRQPAVAAVRALDGDRVHAQIRAVAEYAMALPAARPVYGITGFCWGGTAAFEHATRHDDLMAAVVFYGSSPAEEDLSRVRVPVMGHYGGDDERVNATIPRAEEVLGEAFVPLIHDGAGHGFMRQLDGRDGANRRAAARAWPMAMGFFHGALLGRDAGA